MLFPLLLFAALTRALPPLAAPGCLPYGPETVSITGTLARHMFYGAPGFGEDPQHDHKETGFYLELATPICGLRQSSSPMPTARSMPRAAARSMPSVTMWLCGLRCCCFSGAAVSVMP